MKHIVRTLAILAAAVVSLAITPATASASASGFTPASNLCEGFPILTMEHENAAGEVVAVSTMTFTDPPFQEGLHCAHTEKVGPSVGVEHEITLVIAWGVGDVSRESTRVVTDGGPTVSLEWLHHCTGITVTMRELDGTVVFHDQSPFVHCPV